MTRTNTPITVADVARHAGPPAMGFQHLPRCPTRPPRWFSSRRRQKNHGRATAAACQQLADRRRLDFRRCPADRCRQAAIDLWLLFMLRAQAARTCKVGGRRALTQAHPLWPRNIGATRWSLFSRGRINITPSGWSIPSKAGTAPPASELGTKVAADPAQVRALGAEHPLDRPALSVVGDSGISAKRTTRSRAAGAGTRSCPRTAATSDPNAKNPGRSATGTTCATT
jgi:hypothetical protein